MLVALSLHKLEDPRRRAKAATRKAARSRPKFLEATKQAEAEATATADKEAAANLSTYSRRVVPTPSPHSAFQSIDLAQHSVVVSLAIPPQENDGGDYTDDKTGHPSVSTKATSRTSCSSTSPAEKHATHRAALRHWMGALPFAISSALGLSPCQYGFECALRPVVDREALAAIAATAARDIAAATLATNGGVCSQQVSPVLRNESSSSEEKSAPPPLRCCPVCLSKLSLALLESGVSFGPAAKERLMLASFSTNSDLVPWRGLVKNDLEWSELFLQAIELELFGSSAAGSAAIVAHQSLEPKPFDTHRHRFRVIDSTVINHTTNFDEKHVQENDALELLVASQAGIDATSAPPYPGSERFKADRMRFGGSTIHGTVAPKAAPALLRAASSTFLHGQPLAPWEAGEGQLWLEHSLVSRKPHVKAMPGSTWVDPTSTRFGGVASFVRDTDTTGYGEGGGYAYGAFNFARAQCN